MFSVCRITEWGKSYHSNTEFRQTNGTKKDNDVRERKLRITGEKAGRIDEDRVVLGKESAWKRDEGGRGGYDCEANGDQKGKVSG